MNRTYLVVGEVGEYSDRNEWCVAAYSSLEQAEDHCRRLAEWYSHVVATTESYSVVRAAALKACVLDVVWAKGKGEYSDEVRYVVVDVPGVVHVDEYLETFNDGEAAVVVYEEYVGKRPDPPPVVYACGFCRSEKPSSTGPMSCKNCSWRPMMKLKEQVDAEG